MGWLRYRWPAFVWAGVIWTFSTSSFSAARTAPLIVAILHWLLPHVPEEILWTLHGLIRKSAHVVEYFVFGWLALRAIRSGRREWHWSWAAAAVAIAAGYAATDELHQAFVPTRGPSIWDVLLDTCGAALAMLLCYWLTRLRKNVLPPQNSMEASEGSGR